MKLKIIKLFLMPFLWVSLHTIIADPFQSDLDIKALDEQVNHALVFIDSDASGSIIELKVLLPDYQWSSKFENLYKDIKNEGTVALYEQVDDVINECLEACNNLLQDQLHSVKTNLENYKKILQAGKAHLNARRNHAIDQAKTCKAEKICQLTVGCLAVEGRLCVRGIDYSNLNTLALALRSTGIAVGPTGPTGPAGANGANGANGLNGATGAPGAPGVGGILGYAYACNTATITVAAGGNVTFSLSASPSSGITPPAPAGEAFTILASGVYYIQYHVRGTPSSLTPPSALQFEVTVNDETVLGCSTYASSVQSTSLAAEGTEAVNGYTIVNLTLGDTVRLHNITLSSTDSVSLAAVPVGGTAATNASMLIIRLA